MLKIEMLTAGYLFWVQKIRLYSSNAKLEWTISDLPFYDIFVPQKLPRWKNFDDVISCDLWFRSPPIKHSGYANSLEIAWKKFLKTFFFGEHLRLCPWSLALASNIPVFGLERVCPRKGCPWPWPQIFLCPWPWPRALCPRLHLCWLQLWE